MELKFVLLVLVISFGYLKCSVYSESEVASDGIFNDGYSDDKYYEQVEEKRKAAFLPRYDIWVKAMKTKANKLNENKKAINNNKNHDRVRAIKLLRVGRNVNADNK